MISNKFIKAVIQGDEAARKALYNRYKVVLFQICLRYGRDRAEAEDMLQEGFIVIFKDIKQYGGKGNFEGWLKRVMINSALRFLRKWKRPIDDIENHFDNSIFSQKADFDANLGLQELTQMIQTLPVGYRTVFNLYAIDGYTHKEIAAQLNIAEGTSKSQLSKARKMLQQLLENQLSKEL